MSVTPEEAQIQTGFKASFVSYLLKADLRDLQRVDVAVELAMVSVPLMMGAVTAVRGYTAWNRRFMHDIVNISLNSYTKGADGRHYFQHRVIGELPLMSLIPREGQRRLRNATRGATVDQPILDLDRTTQTIVSNGVCNQVSSLCASAFLARDLGSTRVTSDEYVVVLTSEPEKVKMKKIRAMVVKTSSLREIAQRSRNDPKPVIGQRYAARWKLMKHLAEEFAKIDGPNKPYDAQNKFFKLELVAIV
eukprot:TRINITY_DN24974_c0_g1_i1.p1 TRINITY_DN24974_c0_g1~~TRINITY_DN24974_c0_g1_i1.p1  ORF type:complete len:248 (+),score=20.51 TRINITY_DN24974_c0_g1_i1:57-800(+)